jgi:signal transduction histidine kinase
VTKIGLYRVLQEALSNAARHARGADVAVTLSSTDDRVELEVRDRGGGFDVGTTHTSIGGRSGRRRHVAEQDDTNSGAGRACRATHPERAVLPGGCVGKGVV